jgi:hypothetical protein
MDDELRRNARRGLIIVGLGVAVLTSYRAFGDNPFGLPKQDFDSEFWFSIVWGVATWTILFLLIGKRQ